MDAEMKTEMTAGPTLGFLQTDIESGCAPWGSHLGNSNEANRVSQDKS